MFAVPDAAVDAAQRDAAQRDAAQRGAAQRGVLRTDDVDGVCGSGCCRLSLVSGASPDDGRRDPRESVAAERTPTVGGVGYPALDEATAALQPPFAVLDLDALHANAHAMAGRACGKPIRVASKSVRCRPVIEAVLALDGFRGVLALTLPEALWLASTGNPDVVVGYPSTDLTCLEQLVGNQDLVDRVTIMIDSVAQSTSSKTRWAPRVARSESAWTSTHPCA